MFQEKLKGVLRDKRVALLYPLSEKIMSRNNLADWQIVRDVLSDLSSACSCVDYVSLDEFGILGFLIRATSKIKPLKNNIILPDDKTNGVIFIFSLMVLKHLSLIDPFFRRQISQISDRYDFFIIFSPWFVNGISRSIRYSNCKLILYELNYEKKFLEYQLEGVPRVMKSILLRLTANVDSEAIRQSLITCTISERDRMILSQLHPSAAIGRYYPYTRIVQRLSEKSEDLAIRDAIRGGNVEINLRDTVITFIGSNSKVNVLSVKSIFRLSSLLANLSDALKLIIIGEVYNAFLRSEATIPENVIFTGYVEAIEPIMRRSDFFILFEFMTTGSEVKAKKFADFAKPVIVVSNEKIDEYRDILADFELRVSSIDQIIPIIVNYLLRKHEAERRHNGVFQN